MQANHNLAPESSNRLIFVGGAPRSGTTLLQNMLDSHMEIAGGPEFDLIEKIVELRNSLQLKVTTKRIAAYLESRDVDRSIASFMAGMLLPYAGKKGRFLLSEKTPSNVLVFGELLEIFPRAKFILCVRDPRAVVSSLLTVRKKAIRRNGRFSVAAFTRRFWRAAWHTRKCMESGSRAMQMCPNRVFLVNYEDLVSAPESVTRDICKFLGVDWDERMVEPDRVKHDGEVAIDGIWYDEKRYYSKPDPSRINLWREKLSWYQRRCLELYFGKYHVTSDLGYEIPERAAFFRILLVGAYLDSAIRVVNRWLLKIISHL